MFSRNLIIMACLIAVSVSGQNRIWSNGAYGKVDPREYLPESLYTNCVAWYCMNQNPAQFATWGVPDGSVVRNNGYQTTANSRPAFAGQNYGTLAFDGIDDFLSIDAGLYSSCTNVAFSFWINPDIQAIREVYIYLNNNAGGAARLEIRSVSNNIGVVRTRDQDGSVGIDNSVSMQTTSGLFAVSNWSHVVVSMGTSGNRIYCNGATQAISYAYNGGSNGLATLSGTNWQKRIGNRDASLFGSAIPYGGKLGDFAVFSKEFSLSEATNLFIRSKGAYGL